MRSVLPILRRLSSGSPTSYETFVSDYAIRAEGLAKRYVIGGPKERYQTLREALVRRMSAPLRPLWSGIERSHAAEMFWALKGVSFEIKRGEVVGIIGRNGAGKSTLLKILSRITVPTEGRAAIRGRVASLLEVGTGFHPELTGRENIYLNGSILGMSQKEIDKKFDEIVAFAEVEKFIDTPLKRYSSGMYVRLAFAVAAHLDPEVLLVDEVLAVGDASFQRKCLGKMDSVAKQGRTVVLITHQMNQIRILCKRCMWLDRGQLRMSGPTLDVISAYEADLVSWAAKITSSAKSDREAEFLGWRIVDHDHAEKN